MERVGNAIQLLSHASTLLTPLHRIRKVKCDEAKPGCKRCSSTGRKCDGYPATASRSPPETVATQRQLLPSSAACWYPSPTSPLAIAPGQLPVNDYEALAYEWFIRKSASVLWHIAPVKKWVRLAIQLGTREPTVFYAATAVASIHRVQPNTYHHTLTPPWLPEKHAGLNQYCKATASLQRYIDDAISNGSHLEPILLCCLLFVVFEIFQGNGHQAVSHLRWCKALIDGADARATTKSNSSPQPSPDIRDELLIMFRGLEAEIDVAPRTLHLPTDPKAYFTVPKIVPGTCFASIEIAKESLCRIMDANAGFREDLVRRASNCMVPADKKLRGAVKYCIAHCLSRTIDLRHDEELERREEELGRAHDNWSRLFTEMKSRSTATTSAIFRLMEIQLAFSKRTLHTCHIKREDLHDQYEAEDSRTLDLIETYFTQTTSLASLTPVSPPRIVESPIGPEPQKSFSLDDGILPALYFICLKCRSSSIRHRAWRILRNADRREGMHYSRGLADRAEEVIRLEEDHAKDLLGVTSLDGCRIPEAARVSDVVVESVSPFDTRVICGKFRHENDDGLEILEYQRFREPFINPTPVWQTVLKKQCQDGSRWMTVGGHVRNLC